jgi:SAM-dependent methyltransferase
MRKQIEARFFNNAIFKSRPEALSIFASASLPFLEKLPPDAAILDLGCGSGELVRLIKGRKPFSSVVGIDISRPNVRAAKTACPDCEFDVADFLEWRGGQKFDAVLSDNVFHLIDCSDDALASKLSNRLSKDGVVIASIPLDNAVNRLISLQRLLWSYAPRAIDSMALKICQLVFPNEPERMLAERLVYLRLPPTRTLDHGFIDAMSRAGLRLLSSSPMSESIPFKLKHALTVWEKVSDH